MKKQCRIVAGTFFGGTIEPGTFHSEDNRRPELTRPQGALGTDRHAQRRHDGNDTTAQKGQSNRR